MNKTMAVKILNYLILILAAGFILYPVFIVLMSSFKTNGQIMNDIFGLPESIKFDNYVRAWTDGTLYLFYKNNLHINHFYL